MKVNPVGSADHKGYKSQNKNVNFGFRIHPERVGDSIVRKNKQLIIHEVIDFFKGTNKIKNHFIKTLKGLFEKHSEVQFFKDGSKSKDYKTYLPNSRVVVTKEETRDYSPQNILLSKTVRKFGDDKKIGTYETIIKTDYYPDGKTIKVAKKTKRYLYKDIIEKTTTEFSEKGKRTEQREIQGSKLNSYMNLKKYDENGKLISNTPSNHIVDYEFEVA